MGDASLLAEQRQPAVPGAGLGGHRCWSSRPSWASSLLLFVRRDLTAAYVVVMGVHHGPRRGRSSAHPSAPTCSAASPARAPTSWCSRFRQAGTDIQAATLARASSPTPSTRSRRSSWCTSSWAPWRVRTKARFPQGEYLIEQARHGRGADRLSDRRRRRPSRGLPGLPRSAGPASAFHRLNPLTKLVLAVGDRGRRGHPRRHRRAGRCCSSWRCCCRRRAAGVLRRLLPAGAAAEPAHRHQRAARQRVLLPGRPGRAVPDRPHHRDAGGARVRGPRRCCGSLAISGAITLFYLTTRTVGPGAGPGAAGRLVARLGFVANASVQMRARRWSTARATITAAQRARGLDTEGERPGSELRGVRAHRGAGRPGCHRRGRGADHGARGTRLHPARAPDPALEPARLRARSAWRAGCWC